MTASRIAAQIPRVFRVFVILVRTTYLLTALVVLACTAPLLVSFLPWRPGNTFMTLVLLVMCLLPLRALVRLVSRSELIPASHIRERPVVASVVVIACLLGGALFLLAGWVGLTSLPEDDIGGPLGGAIMLAAMLFAVALLTGELVLVGRLSRALRSGPVF